VASAGCPESDTIECPCQHRHPIGNCACSCSVSLALRTFLCIPLDANSTQPAKPTIPPKRHINKTPATKEGENTYALFKLSFTTLVTPLIISKNFSGKCQYPLHNDHGSLGLPFTPPPVTPPASLACTPNIDRSGRRDASGDVGHEDSGKLQYPIHTHRSYL
jgi:hypothetical protein